VFVLQHLQPARRASAAAVPARGALGLGKDTFTYEEMAAATGYFSRRRTCCWGSQGGIGYVHRGVLPGDRAVAVKQLKARSGQGERQFQAEVNISSRVFRDEYSAKVGRVLLQRYELGEEVAPAAAAGSELEFFIFWFLIIF
jgi:hypothetical protein